MALALLAQAMSACGARDGVRIRREEAGVGQTPQPEVCNGLDDDLDGLASSRSDAAPFDSGRSHDARVDSATDASTDVSLDGATDAAPDSQLDSNLDAQFDAQSDAARDARVEAGQDARVDARVDASNDAGSDAGTADLDLFVDEDFRDSVGRYVHDQHCGRCGNACVINGANETLVGCRLVGEVPKCVALACRPGFTPSRNGACVPIHERMCLFCTDDGDCGDFEGAHCARVADESRCTVACTLGCPAGYTCRGNQCEPASGSCSCSAGGDFDIACGLTDPVGMLCAGTAHCGGGVQTRCVAPMELCDGVDQDCDGVVDNGFVDARGAYSVDIHNCGRCGVDCTRSRTPEGTLVCGGDPLSPSCVLRCPDTEDGLQPGDRIDADRNIATGCECHFSNAMDAPGPLLAEGEMLDVNCDGADGIVVSSIYVAPDGDDGAIGSPTRPLRTLAGAMARAEATLGTATPRTTVFVASGVYAETLRLPDGVLVFGGYRRDFRALDPSGFRSEVRAVSGMAGPGGSALEIRSAGRAPSGVAWMTFTGLDAELAVGAYVIDPGPNLTLDGVEIRAGNGGSGMSGMPGMPGQSSTPARPGAVPRAAVERNFACVAGNENTVQGGAPGTNVCGSQDVGGGAGGSPICPRADGGGGTQTQPSGERGRGAAAGNGGEGGQDSRGPIVGNGCPTAVCCGLSDFSVPTNFTGPQPGAPGGVGTNGMGGVSCSNPFGSFASGGEDLWVPDTGRAGTVGAPGSGGGGGGAGGGTVMDFMRGVCEFADGLGGGGGGGGGGGCGGTSGTGGSSGGPSVGVLVRYTRPANDTGFVLQRALIIAGEGGRGGDGGPGGSGGSGGAGAFGGELPRSARITPTLAGPYGGARGGRGGNGGDGGGGGGGCGGPSVGVWVTGDIGSFDPSRFRTDNNIMTRGGGRAGTGGGGAAPGASGLAGPAMDVLAR